MVATCYYYYKNNTPGSIRSPGLKTKNAKIKMSDGHRSGRSTGRVSCKSTELKRCSMMEMRWNKYEVLLVYYYYYFVKIGRSSRGGRQKLILEIITLMVNHPSGSH